MTVYNSSNVKSTIVFTSDINDAKVPAGEDFTLLLGDDAGSNSFILKNYSGTDIFEVNSLGAFYLSGSIYSNTLKIPDDYGSDISTDGSFDNWDDATTLTDWDIFDFGGSLDRESVKVYAAPYSIKFTEAPAGGQKVIGQLQSGLNSSYVYRARFYAATDNVGTGKMTLLFFDSNNILTANIWNFTTEVWEAFTGSPTNDQQYSPTLTSDFARYTSPSVQVPATNNIYITYNGTGNGGDVTYLDETTFGTFVPANQVNLFDFISVSDGGDLDGLDYIFRMRDVNGSTLFGMTASGEFITSSGIYNFSAEPVQLSAITGNVEWNGLTVAPYKTSTDLADDGYIDLPADSAGWGEIFVGDNEERARFSWSSDATVTLMENTANVKNTDTDNNFCIFDNSNYVRIKNRLGSSKNIKYIIYY